MDKLHVMSFILTTFYRRCPFQRVLTGFALYREFCCTLHSLALTQLDFLVKSDYLRVF
ncbi:hypothetical protein Hanom_Chr10g00910981 [Helianthus anomalus]